MCSLRKQTEVVLAVLAAFKYFVSQSISNSPCFSMGFLPPRGEEMDGVCSLKISYFLDNLLSALQLLFLKGRTFLDGYLLKLSYVVLKLLVNNNSSFKILH